MVKRLSANFLSLQHIMKKALLFLWTVFYLGTACGATVHLHYCMGEMTGWDFCESPKAETCPNCGMETKVQHGKNCCKDVPQCIKAQKQDSVITPTDFTSLPDLLPVTLPYIHTRYTPALAVINFHYGYAGFRGPPGKGAPVFIKNCVFRI